MTIVPVLVLALAVWQLVEAWHHSPLKPRVLALLEPSTLAQLLSCPFCLSSWVGLIAAALWRWALGHQQTVLGSLIWVLLTGLAVARLANIGNDLLAWPQITRTPRHDEELSLDQDP